MTFSELCAIAEELASLSEAHPPLASAADEEVEAHLSRREEIIWKLGGACTPTVLVSATPEERRRLADLLQRVEAATRAMSEAANRSRDDALRQAFALPAEARYRERHETRFTERIA